MNDTKLLYLYFEFNRNAFYDRIFIGGLYRLYVYAMN